MKYVLVALVLAVGGDVALNQHRYVDSVLGNIAILVRGSANAASDSLFAW